MLLIQKWKRRCSLMLMTVLLPPLIQTTTLTDDYVAMVSYGLSSTPSLQYEDEEQAFQNILCSCVEVFVEGHKGSGSILRMTENEIIIVTNRHVLQYWKDDSYVTFFNGVSASARLFGTSEQKDVGFVSVSIHDLPIEELLYYRNVRLSMQEPEQGDVYFAVDLTSDTGGEQIYPGEVISPSVFMEEFETLMFYGKGTGEPGMSGGGVFDGYGNYIGMMTGATTDNQIAAVPAKDVIEEYKKSCAFLN